MLPAELGGGAADLKLGLEALSTFKKRVDDLLANFEGSPGSSGKVAAHTLAEGSFGPTDFHEAKGLHTEYVRVHERITSLSKTLGLQIEAMQIAVHAADVGFNGLEEDLRQRFWEIRTEVNQERDQALHKRENHAKHTKASY